jgi:hypothetical protein
MCLRPTHGDESLFLAPIDSKWVMRDFRRSVIGMFQQLREMLDYLRLRRAPVVQQVDPRSRLQVSNQRSGDS